MGDRSIGIARRVTEIDSVMNAWQWVGRGCGGRGAVVIGQSSGTGRVSAERGWDWVSLGESGLGLLRTDTGGSVLKESSLRVCGGEEVSIAEDDERKVVEVRLGVVHGLVWSQDAGVGRATMAKDAECSG